MKKTGILIVLTILSLNIIYSQTNSFPPSGNVGIGTISPGNKLDVFGELGVGSGSVNGNTTKIFLRNPWSGGKTWAISSGANNITEASFSIYNWTDNQTAPFFHINSTGNVGIGTSNPLSMLEVKNGNILIRNLDNVDNSSAIMIGHSINYGNYATYGTSLRTITQSAGSNTYGLQFFTQGSYLVGQTEKMRILGNGNVGIGYLNARSKLEISAGLNNPSVAGAPNGNLLISDGSNIGMSFGVMQGVSNTYPGWIQALNNTSSVYYPLLLNPNGGNIGIGTVTPNAKLSIQRPAGLPSIKAPDEGTGSGFVIIDGFTSGSRGNNAVSLNHYIDGDVWLAGGGGNVGIGTTTPSTKLTVKGKILASEVQVVDVGSIPDYVFKPGYKLMTLLEVEKFVKTHNHLPDVPSEQDFKEKGMNMAEMNNTLLQKVEELTLYVIEKDKEITSLKAEKDRQLAEQHQMLLEMKNEIEILKKK